MTRPSVATDVSHTILRYLLQVIVETALMPVLSPRVTELPEQTSLCP
eukprot:SAG11_NODE_10799_length_805_cov_0.852691_1_plen_46_part_10